MVIVKPTKQTTGDNMNKVYIVKGSEDGIIGVYSSKKKARVAAIDYVLAAHSIHSKDAGVLSETYDWIEFYRATFTECTAEIIIEELL